MLALASCASNFDQKAFLVSATMRRPCVKPNGPGVVRKVGARMLLLQYLRRKIVFHARPGVEAAVSLQKVFNSSKLRNLPASKISQLLNSLWTALTSPFVAPTAIVCLILHVRRQCLAEVCPRDLDFFQPCLLQRS